MSDQNQIVNDDEVLDFTHSKRVWLLDQLTANGTKLPEDVKETKIVAQLLDGMDKQALGKKRIRLDEKVVDTQAGAAAIMANILSMAAGQKPFIVQNAVAREVPVLGSDVPAPVLVEGEISTAPYVQDFDTFMKSTSSIAPEED